MNLVTLVSAVILAVILLWSIYNIPILLSGVKHRRKSQGPSAAGNAIRQPYISIIIPLRNEAKVARRCFDAFLDIDYPKQCLEIIAVDGDSEDGTWEICTEYSRNYPSIVKVFRQKGVMGKPAALNIGLQHATGDIVGVFDADSVPEKDILNRVSSYFADKDISAVQGKTVSINEGENMLTMIASKEEKTWFHALLQGREGLKLFIPLTGSCQFIRRRVLQELRGWDEDSLAEDVELAARLLERGNNVRYAHDISCWQETPSTLSSFFTQRMRWFRGYMETCLRYGRLLKKPSRRFLDVEVTLMGPYIMVLCFTSYGIWFSTLIAPLPLDYLLLNPAYIAAVLTAVTLFSIGSALLLTTRPLRLKNLLWIPFIYAYWLAQSIVALLALFNTILHRPRVWRKTKKSGRIAR